MGHDLRMGTVPALLRPHGVWLRYALLAALAFGCEAEDGAGLDVVGPATCQPAPRPGFCMTSGEQLESYGDGVDFTLEGEVLQTGEGYPHQADLHVCMNDILPVTDSPGAVGSWIRLAGDDGEEWWIAIGWPGAPAAFAIGERLRVDYANQDEPFMADTGRAALHRADGELVLWLAIAGSVDDLALPEDIALAAGPARCAESDDCGGWDLYDFEISSDGETVTLPHGESTDVGRYHVVHCGAERGNTSEVQCLDWYKAFAGVFLSAPAGPGPQLRVEPAALHVEQITGHYESAHVVLTNEGSSSVTLDSAFVESRGPVTPEDEFDWRGFWLDPWTIPEGGALIEPGAELSVGISFAALRIGAYEDVLVLETDEPASYRVPLLGTATRCTLPPEPAGCTWTPTETGLTCFADAERCQRICGPPNTCFAVQDERQLVYVGGAECLPPVEGELASFLCAVLQPPDCPTWIEDVCEP